MPYTVVYIKSGNTLPPEEDLEKAKATARALANWNLLVEVQDEHGVVQFAPRPYNEALAH